MAVEANVLVFGEVASCVVWRGREATDRMDVEGSRLRFITILTNKDAHSHTLVMASSAASMRSSISVSGDTKEVCDLMPGGIQISTKVILR